MVQGGDPLLPVLGREPSWPWREPQPRRKFWAMKAIEEGPWTLLLTMGSELP